MLTIAGTKFKGGGGAVKNLALQIPQIALEFPEIRNCFRGTINLELEKGLLVLKPDHRTKPIQWAPDNTQGEIFDLVRIRMEVPVGSPEFTAWLYVAYWSEWRKHLQKHEVIVDRHIGEVRDGTRC